jgi:hypothetical protein
MKAVMMNLELVTKSLILILTMVSSTQLKKNYFVEKSYKQSKSLQKTLRCLTVHITVKWVRKPE